MMAIIYALDEDGYLRTPTAELINDFQFSNRTLELALNAVQSLEPSGVGATSLTECLTLQLIQDYPNHPAQNLAIELITNQLALLADYPGCIAALADILTTEKSTIEHAYKLIQQLNPRPGYDFHSSDNHYIKPDIVILASKETANIFEAEVINQPHKLQLNKTMINLVKSNISSQKQSADNDAKEWLESNRAEADNIINALDFRQSTLQRIANLLAQLQADYFAWGLAHLKPLSLSQVAEQLTVNPSTLSRAIANKYISSPQGVEPIRQLFSAALPKQPDMTNRHAKFVLLNLIKQEPAQSPLSDEALANAMHSTGINISRRAVTKYRLALKIANSRNRKIPNL
jgi:RNA polymerase sigma-54 factor